MKLETVEDYLEVLAGLKDDTKIKIENTDCTILYSIARQIFRGKALTDRQLDVVCVKLNYYRNQFKELGYVNLQEVLNMQTTRQPLRQVDRSQWIKVVDEPAIKKPKFTVSRMRKQPSKDNVKEKNSHIAIRFPFSKKVIQVIEKLAYAHRLGYYHEKGTHIHYFKITENSVYDIVKNFKNKSYDIDQEILDYAEKVKKIKNNPQDYLPGVYELQLKNTTKVLEERITKDLGKLDSNNVYLYKDRSILYGLDHFTDDIHNYTNSKSVLTQRIINRSEPQVFISKHEWSLDAVVSSLVELKRFPLLIVVPEKNPLDYLSVTYQSLKGFIKQDKMSVMFRLDNKTDKNFNQYIKNNNLNNSLAKDTEVVYISSNKKFPKPLFKSNWSSQSVLFLESFRNPKLDTYFNNKDLVVHFDEVESQMGSYGNYSSRQISGYIQKI